MKGISTGRAKAWGGIGVLATVLWAPNASCQGPEDSPELAQVAVEMDPETLTNQPPLPDSEDVSLEPEVESCLRSHEQAQLDRMRGSLISAEKWLMECSQPVCPEAIVADCALWAEEIAASLPSVVIRASRGEEKINEVLVEVDGASMGWRSSGSALPINPGSHTFSVRLADGSSQSQQLTVLEGQQGRLLNFRFSVPLQTRAESDSEPEPTPRRSLWSEISPLTYALSGVALVSTGLFIGFGTDALVVQNRAKNSCDPNCDSEVSDRVKRSAVMADIFLGVAIASTLGATLTYTLVDRREAAKKDAARGVRAWERATTSLELSSLGDGAMLRWKAAL